MEGSPPVWRRHTRTSGEVNTDESKWGCQLGVKTLLGMFGTAADELSKEPVQWWQMSIMSPGNRTSQIFQFLCRQNGVISGEKSLYLWFNTHREDDDCGASLSAGWGHFKWVPELPARKNLRKTVIQRPWNLYGAFEFYMLSCPLDGNWSYFCLHKIHAGWIHSKLSVSPWEGSKL